MTSQIAQAAADAVVSTTSGAGLFSWRTITNAGVVLVAIASAGINRLPTNSHPSVSDVQSNALAATQFVAAKASTTEPIEIHGTIFALDPQPILAKSPGRIQTVLVQNGDTVTAGQTLIQLQNPRLKDNLDEAARAVATAKRDHERLTLRIDLESAESQVALLQSRNDHAESLRNYESDTELFKRGFISRQRLRISRERETRQRLSFETRVQREATTDRSNALHVEESELKLQRCEQRLADIKSQIHELSVRAQADGIVDWSIGRKPVAIGQELSAWDTVASIYQSNCLRIRLDVDEFPEVRIGTIVDFERFGKTHRTTVESISHVDGQNVAVASIPSDWRQKESLQPGQRVNATVARRST